LSLHCSPGYQLADHWIEKNILQKQDFFKKWPPSYKGKHLAFLQKLLTDGTQNVQD
jgi:hypothetical protein